jgi:hypothetical protein
MAAGSPLDVGVSVTFWHDESRPLLLDARRGGSAWRASRRGCRSGGAVARPWVTLRILCGLKEIRAQRFVRNDKNVTPGIAAIGAPTFDHRVEVRVHRGFYRWVILSNRGGSREHILLQGGGLPSRAHCTTPRFRAQAPSPQAGAGVLSHLWNSGPARAAATEIWPALLDVASMGGPTVRQARRDPVTCRWRGPDRLSPQAGPGGVRAVLVVLSDGASGRDRPWSSRACGAGRTGRPWSRPGPDVASCRRCSAARCSPVTHGR